MGNSIIVATFSHAVGLQAAFAGESDICFSPGGARDLCADFGFLSNGQVAEPIQIDAVRGFALSCACIGLSVRTDDRASFLYSVSYHFTFVNILLKKNFGC
jgi:hypothetical protein